jgi:hypothetical protein
VKENLPSSGEVTSIVLPTEDELLLLADDAAMAAYEVLLLFDAADVDADVVVD